MATVTLHYRDGDNYKCTWEADISDAIARALPPPDGDGLYDITALGLTVYDIPLIAEFGFNETSDHEFATLQDIVFDKPAG